MTAVAALSELGNDRIRPGGNQPPAFDAHKANVDDIKVEAGNWLDGGTISSAEEAEAVNLLLDMARKAKTAGDAARLEETKPHRTMVTTINAAWETQVIAPADLVVQCCVKALTPWNLAEKKRKEDAAALAEAERLAEIEALRAARAEADGSLQAAEQIDQIEASVKASGKVAKAAGKAAQTGLGLRTTHRAEVTDFAAAARHFWQPYHDRFEALVLTIAQEQVRAGKRDIPGITIHADAKAI